MVLVAVHVSVAGLYLPPVFKYPLQQSTPPQTIISVPVQIAVCSSRAAGALAVLVVVQLSLLGTYLQPVFNWPPGFSPPQTIISVPVHTAVGNSRPAGALVRLVGVQVSSVQAPDGPAIVGR